MPWWRGQLLPFFVFTACTDKEQSVSARFYPFSSHHHRTFTFRTWATLLQCHESSMFRIHRHVNYNPNIYFSMSGFAQTGGREKRRGNGECSVRTSSCLFERTHRSISSLRRIPSDKRADHRLYRLKTRAIPTHAGTRHRKKAAVGDLPPVRRLSACQPR